VAEYILIESRDPFDSNDVPAFWNLAEGLARGGNTVTLFLVQNGVLPARPSTASEKLAGLSRAGVQVLADDFSLRERGIRADRLAAGVKAAALDVVLDQIAAGRKALWH
jgi:hypothetical protein